MRCVIYCRCDRMGCFILDSIVIRAEYLRGGYGYVFYLEVAGCVL